MAMHKITLSSTYVAGLSVCVLDYFNTSLDSFIKKLVASSNQCYKIKASVLNQLKSVYLHVISVLCG